MPGKLTLGFDPEEVRDFLGGLHITRIERGGDMGDLLEADNCREEEKAMREGRVSLTVLEEL